MSLTAAVKGACNANLNEKLPDHTQKAPVLHYVPLCSCEAMCPLGKIRKQRQKNPRVTP